MLKFLINPEAEFETEGVKNLIESKKVIYALSSTSSFDLNALIKLTKKNNFSSPKKSKNNFFQLKGAKRLFPWQAPRRRSPRELHHQKRDNLPG